MMLFVLQSLLVGLALASSLLPADAPPLSSFAATPPFVSAGLTSSVIFTVTADPRTTRQKLAVVRLNDDGEGYTIIGLLRDDGLGADPRKDDGSFTLQATLTEKNPGIAKFRAVALENGKLSSIRSSVVALIIEPQQAASNINVPARLAALFNRVGIFSITPTYASTSEMVQLQWSTSTRSLSVTDRRPSTVPLRNVQGFSPSANTLLIVGLSSKPSLLSWQQIADPRVAVIHDYSSQTDQSTRINRPGDFILTTYIPSDHTVSEIRIYETIWSGVGFTLAPLAGLTITP